MKTELSSLINKTASPTRAGRPKSDSKRLAILGAATDHFLVEGYKRTSMDAIAAEAGVSKQTVYSHFNNKDDLFRECILAKVRHYGLDMAAFTPDMPVRDVLQQTGLSFLDLLSDEHAIEMHRLLIAETVAFPKLAATFWETGPQATINSIAGFLEACTAAGGCNIREPQQAASDFLLLVEGHYLKRRLMRHTKEMRDAEKLARVQRAVDNILRLYDQPASHS